jgi:hypothetical protein
LFGPKSDLYPLCVRGLGGVQPMWQTRFLNKFEVVAFQSFPRSSVPSFHRPLVLSLPPFIDQNFLNSFCQNKKMLQNGFLNPPPFLEGGACPSKKKHVCFSKKKFVNPASHCPKTFFSKLQRKVFPKPWTTHTTKTTPQGTLEGILGQEAGDDAHRRRQRRCAHPLPLGRRPPLRHGHRRTTLQSRSRVQRREGGRGDSETAHAS